MRWDLRDTSLVTDVTVRVYGNTNQNQTNQRDVFLQAISPKVLVDFQFRPLGMSGNIIYVFPHVKESYSAFM